MNVCIMAQPQKAATPSFTPARTGLLQRRPASWTEPATVPPIVREVLRSPGRPLDPATRTFMEQRFGHDFSRVRVHSDARAAESARAVNALAYTVGRDVVFGARQYAPEDSGGRRLLAHELTHVVQQGPALRATQTTLALGHPQIAAEREADRASWAVMHGQLFEATRMKAMPVARQVLDAGVEESPRDAGLPAGVPTAPEPAAPGPEIELQSRGRRERLDPRKITAGIWWFNGATPTLAGYYPTEVLLNTGLPATGRFRYNIKTEARKLALLDNGTEKRSLTVNNDPSPIVRGIGPSTSPNDVELEISHAPPGSNLGTVYTTQLQVRAPHRLGLLGCSHAAAGSHGYKTTFSMKVFDNFDVQMPYIDVNEDFTTGKLAPGVSSHWRAPLAARTKGSTITLGDAIFDDEYAVEVTGGPPGPDWKPQLQNPQSPLGNRLIATFTHSWFVGSRRTGQGVKVSEHLGRLFSDHGQYYSFLSPYAFVVRPVNCPA